MPARSAARMRIRAARSWPKAHGEEAPDLRLSEADEAELTRLAKIIDYKIAGSLIYSQGDEADFLYLLAGGIVRTARLLNDGERQVLAFLWPGDLFGLAENGKYVNSAEVISAAKVYRFPVKKLESFLMGNPNIHDAFLVKAVHDLRNMQRQLIVMGRFDLPRRLAAFLLDCSAHENFFEQKGHLLTLPMNRTDIADYLGTSPETVTRALSRLETSGMLRRVTARKIELDTKALKAFIDFE